LGAAVELPGILRPLAEGVPGIRHVAEYGPPLISTLAGTPAPESSGADENPSREMIE